MYQQKQKNLIFGVLEKLYIELQVNFIFLLSIDKFRSPTTNTTMP